MLECLHKSLPEPMLTYCWLGPSEQISVEFWLKFKHFIEGNIFENVCKMAALLPTLKAALVKERMGLMYDIYLLWII